MAHLNISNLSGILTALTTLVITPSAGLAGSEPDQIVYPLPAQSAWAYKFTIYGWLPWLSGDGAVRGRAFDINVTPKEMLEHLDWSGLPIWMSYAEARNGPLSLFNDIVYASLSDDRSFARSSSRRITDASLGGNIEADYQQATIELGGAYQIWSGASPVGGQTSALDFVAGVRYWRQALDLSADVRTTIGLDGLIIVGERAIAKSGSINWVDPFIGGRLRQQIAPGQELVVRGNMGGFGAGSAFSWQMLATWEWRVLVRNGYTADAYLGYRALYVDYTKGSGVTRYEYNVLQQGPVLGVTIKF